MTEAPRRLRLPRRELPLDQGSVIMGVVNVTPDSFSDGGRFLDGRAAVEQGLKLAAEGARILDIGGETTRPGSEPTPAAVELDRVLPVIRELKARCDAVISIDTNKAEVAAAAIQAGAEIINDITALRGDPEMAALAARTRAGLVLMHMLGTPRTMQQDPRYADVVAEVRDFLAERAAAALAAGVEREAIALDPGIGFGKTLGHNLELIRNLPVLARLGYPVLLGASRKAFIGQLTGRATPAERLWGSVGVHVLGAALGARILRVHDVAPLREALLVTDAVLAAREAS
ncbi:MAG: dihydropteroate synthase [Desulfarculus sp.]|nr:dihydropteroate synthase [Desulfarculus sp.]